MILPTICIVPAADRDNLNLVWEAMGRGPGTFSRGLCAIDAGATYEEPATHYLMQDMGPTDAEVAEWQALTAGDLPDIGVNVWGVSGIISAADAQAAGAGLLVFSAAGIGSGSSQQTTDWRNGTLLGIGLQFVPDEPI